METTIIYPQTSINICTPQIDTERVCKQLQPAKVYRQELKLYRRMAEVIDRYPTLTQTALWLAGIATMVYTLVRV